MVDNAISSGKKVHQYYGKWPFWRFAGMQEPASVVFSVLNFMAHLSGYRKIKRALPNSHPMKPYYILWAVCSMNAWLWSSVFHTRDLPITEKLDYFSAALVILNALYGTIIRLFHLYPQPERVKLTGSTGVPGWKILRGACVLVYAGHIYYLTSGPRFDYTYNTIFNLVIGLSHNILWTLYALPSSLSVLKSRFPGAPKGYRPSFVNKAGLFVLLTTLATSLELFDFPPWFRTIDAHSLWHAATAPIGYLWYDFLVQDSLDPSWQTPLLRQRPE
ncbi:PER1 [Coprinopsis cinerea AmutBmut pab1-1]|nr:PER1 [Coprinopsis cinerea AmutBmut pab1-1]